MRRYRSVLVTGTSRGLGAALARELLARDYHVMLTARAESELQALIESLPPGQRERAHRHRADLTVGAELQALAREAEQRLEGIDVLINNAGHGHYKPLAQWSAAEVADCLSLNLLAPMLLAQALLPGMLERRRGMIVNVASDLARRPLANMAPYAASKHGLLGFSGSLLREVKAQGIKVTAVMPGIIDTAFNGATEGSKEDSWALRPAMLASRIVDLLELPENVVVDELTIHPMHQDF
jgi:short-subunit dehydrogenase